MSPPTHISHYFEKEYGPFLSICNLNADETAKIIESERGAKTGFNRFAHGQEFFNFRRLADDLIIERYSLKFGHKPVTRPFYAVLGDADVVGGLYRDPQKIQIPVDSFSEGELTFMCPDHFHLVSFNGVQVSKHFGLQIPRDYSELKYPYYGKLLTYQELLNEYDSLKLEEYLTQRTAKNCWYRYIEAQIWASPETLCTKYDICVDVAPETWRYSGVTYSADGKKSVSTPPSSP